MTRAPVRGVSRRSVIKGGLAVAVASPALARLSGKAFAAEEAQLNVYNWDTYIGETTLSDFTAATDINVQYDLYANNEELFAKLKAGNPGYDVIFPSDYMIETMISLGMLVEIDHGKISNMANIDPDPNFSNPPFNPGLKYGVPYMWGTIGIGYRKSAVSAVPDSWAVIFDSDEYAGRISLLGDMRAMIGLALKYLGYSMNTTNPDEIAAARDLMIKAKKNIKAFAPDAGQDMLLAGEVDLAVEWNGDIVQIMEEDDDISYVVPNEGTMVWIDNICIPTGGPHPDNAHAFLNYILDAQVNADIANYIRYATSNAAAREFVTPEDLANPAIYPPAEVVAKSESLIDVGDATRLFDEAWTAIQAA
ncbi:MAG TPA: spermidine/putrescine ABC transporter substrate-binding protein [Alphaproteobacteria bacterium]|nr:spermidine/putrescine ABC transporter substrate-binding protein [Alphaproteobacteria bacterium]